MNTIKKCWLVLLNALFAERVLAADIDEWHKQAKAGDALAQYNLGNAYYKGEGVTQDAREAVKWYRLAAEQGLAKAQSNLGVLYAKGEGVTQDKRETVKWWRLAAEQGHASAQYNLGVSYSKGEGVIQNFSEAYIWYSLAAVHGDKDAMTYRDNTAAKMSQTELHQAQAEARERLAEIDRKAGK